ncbi:MAG: integrin alpha, partial [Planctomycetota bacterium]|nr:integrin alpha [Planctomycetota bacterium]
MAVLRRAPRKLVPPSVLVLTWAANGPAVADLSGSPVVWEVRGCREARLGAVLRPLDDVDGDGVPDLVVAAPEFPHVPRGWGYVAILSGRTGETLRRWASADPTVLYARALDVIGDVDGDGLRDVVVHDGRRLEVVSPVSGEVLYRLAELPGSVPGIFDRAGDLGDLDGDGVHDFFETNSTLFVSGAEVGRVAARSGRDGRLLWETLGGDELGALARSVVAVPDVTGDGVTDLVVGQSRGGADRPTGGLVLLSGVDGSVVEDFVPDPTLRAFGSRDLVLLGDEDGDGRVEVAVSAHLASEGRRVDVGWVGVFEIPDFRLSWSLYGPNARTERLRGSELGYRLAGAGDVDRDGVVDVLISTDNSRLKGLGTNFGRLYLRSGRSGQLLQVYEAAEQFGVYFSSLSALGDVDGDGQ